MMRNQSVTSVGVLTINAFSFLSVLKSFAEKSVIVCGDSTKLKVVLLRNFSTPLDVRIRNPDAAE